MQGRGLRTRKEVALATTFFTRARRPRPQGDSPYPLREGDSDGGGKEGDSVSPPLKGDKGGFSFVENSPCPLTEGDSKDLKDFKNLKNLNF